MIQMEMMDRANEPQPVMYCDRCNTCMSPDDYVYEYDDCGDLCQDCMLEVSMPERVQSVIDRWRRRESC